jgi:hypothetical protein
VVLAPTALIGHYALVAATDYSGLLSQLSHRQFIQFCVGNGVRLDLGGSPFYEITIESPLSIAASNIEHAAPTSTEVLVALRDLLLQPVQSVTERDGELIVVFESVTITVQPDQRYEAWQIRADDETLIVCMPGGGLSAWFPE